MKTKNTDGKNCALKIVRKHSALAALVVTSLGGLSGFAAAPANADTGYGPMMQMLFTYPQNRVYQCAVDIVSDQDGLPKTEFKGAQDCYAGGAAPSKIQVLLDLDSLPDTTEVRNVFVHAQALGEYSRSFRVEEVASQATLTDKPVHLELTFALENTAFITERFIRGDRFELEAVLELWNKSGFVGYSTVTVLVVLL
ncbi:MAG TPA: hypothetical protein VJB59_10350 [Bdellovibrionota bacterium]|nr:hypothetical protein [Bdellovibrionota bacterium]